MNTPCKPKMDQPSDKKAYLKKKVYRLVFFMRKTTHNEMKALFC